MEHYEENYFNWQKNIGAFGGTANLFKFKKYINNDYKIIDFGSGGGFLLSNIDAKEKLGIEINPVARENANKFGITTYDSSNKIEDNWADLIISNHALEHVKEPLTELQNLYKKLKPDGKIVFVTPHEKRNRYKTNDINAHLYTWSEMNLGNLFTEAGFKVIEVREIKHKWPPFFSVIFKIFGKPVFHFTCRIWGLISNRISQVRIVATKTTTSNTNNYY